MGRVSVLRVHSTRWPCAPWQRHEDGEEALPSRRSRALGTFGQSLSTVLPALESQGGSTGWLSPLPSVQCPVSVPGGVIRSQGGGPGEPPLPWSRLGPALPLPLGSRWGHSPRHPTSSDSNGVHPPLPPRAAASASLLDPCHHQLRGPQPPPSSLSPRSSSTPTLEDTSLTLTGSSSSPSPRPLLLESGPCPQ